jgi:hypothetical protein
MIILLITLCILLTIGVVYCIIHIKLINEELTKISEDQSLQNEDIRNVMNAHINLVNALTKNIQEPEEEYLNKFYGVKGEA